MKIKVQDLQPGMLVMYTQGKGILTVAKVTPWERELYPQQYSVSFYGIAYADVFSEDTEFEVIGDIEG